MPLPSKYANRPMHLRLTSSSESRTALGPIVGGAVAGITVFILAVASVLWYRFKKHSRNGESQHIAPFPEEHVAERPSSDSDQV